MRANPTIRLRGLILGFIAVAFGGHLCAQMLTGIGTVAPSPGTNDIYQLSTQGNQTFPDGKNYYTDNNPPPGQAFTTGTNAMRLVSLAIKTAGLDSGGGYGTPIGSVGLLGGGKLKFPRDANGLRVSLPEKFNGQIALTLKIRS